MPADTPVRPAPRPPVPPAAAERRWLLADADDPVGEPEVAAGLVAGAIDLATEARPVGGTVRRPLREWPAFAAAAAAGPGTFGDPSRPPLDSVMVGWLGLAFTPLWSALFAYVNVRRLDGARPETGPPAAVGAAWFLGDWLLAAAVPGGLTRPGVAVLALAWQAAAAWLVWRLCLRRQVRPYRRYVAAGHSPAGWLAPASAGLPMLALTAYGLVAPHLPPGPEATCLRLSMSETPEEAGRYAALELRPLLAATFPSGEPWNGWEFALAPAGAVEGQPHLRRAAFAASRLDRGKRRTREGYFLLADRGRGWEVTEVAVAYEDGRTCDPPVEFGRAHRDPRGPAAVIGESVTRDAPHDVWGQGIGIGGASGDRLTAADVADPRGPWRVPALVALVAGLSGYSALTRRRPSPSGKTRTDVGG